MRTRRPAVAAARLAAGYLVVSTAWILFSDRAVHVLAQGDVGLEDWMQSVKGLGFVAVTALGLFSVSARYLGLVQASTRQLVTAYDETLAGWAAALDLRDESTAHHSERVVVRTVGLAARFGFAGDELEAIRRGATLHDIGKMGVPDEILRKAGPLTDDEWAQMRRHPQFAMTMLSGIDYLRPSLDIPWCHHERWDGSGYPRGLRGEQIPLSARLFAVVDVHDAVTSERPYRDRPLSPDEAAELIRAGSGTLFDPRVVDAFLALLADESALVPREERGPAIPQ